MIATYGSGLFLRGCGCTSPPGGEDRIAGWKGRASAEGDIGFRLFMIVIAAAPDSIVGKYQYLSIITRHHPSPFVFGRHSKCSETGNNGMRRMPFPLNAIQPTIDMP